MLVLTVQLLVDFNPGFEAALGRAEYCVVEFCSEDCDFCSQFDGVFNRAAERLEDTGAVFGFFSCRTDPYLCKRYGVNEHPWVAVFKAQEVLQSYYGPRHENVLADWISHWIGK